MLKHWLIAGAMSLALGGVAYAQTYRDSGGTIAHGVVPLVGCSSAGNCSGPASAANPVPAAPAPSSSSSLALTHVATASLGASLTAKASAGNLYGFNCAGITGGAAGYCVAINATAAPSNNASITPLDVCSFSGAAAGCSLTRGIPANYSTGIVILMTTAATPFTYTSGTDTAFISADVQ